MEYFIGILLLIIIVGIVKVYKKLNAPNISAADKDEISQLEKNLSAREQEITTLEKNNEVFHAKLDSFEQLKTEKTQLNERLKNVEAERNSLKNKNITLENKEEARISISFNTSNGVWCQWKRKLENEKVRVGEKKRLDVLSVPTTDGWETPKVANDIPTIDNKQ